MKPNQNKISTLFHNPTNSSLKVLHVPFILTKTIPRHTTLSLSPVYVPKFNQSVYIQFKKSIIYYVLQSVLKSTLSSPSTPTSHRVHRSAEESEKTKIHTSSEHSIARYLFPEILPPPTDYSRCSTQAKPFKVLKVYTSPTRTFYHTILTANTHMKYHTRTKLFYSNTTHHHF